MIGECVTLEKKQIYCSVDYYPDKNEYWTSVEFFYHKDEEYSEASSSLYIGENKAAAFAAYRALIGHFNLVGWDYYKVKDHCERIDPPVVA